MYAQTDTRFHASGGTYQPLIVPVTEDVDYEMPVGLVSHIAIKTTGATAALNVGLTPGGTELVNAEAFAAGEEKVFSIGIKFEVPTLIYITGITSNAVFTIYKF